MSVLVKIKICHAPLNLTYSIWAVSILSIHGNKWFLKDPSWPIGYIFPFLSRTLWSMFICSSVIPFKSRFISRCWTPSITWPFNFAAPVLDLQTPGFLTGSWDQHLIKSSAGNLFPRWCEIPEGSRWRLGGRKRCQVRPLCSCLCCRCSATHYYPLLSIRHLYLRDIC